MTVTETIEERIAGAQAPRRAISVISSGLVIVIATGLACAISFLQSRFAGSNEAAVEATAGLFGLLLVAVMIASLWRSRARLCPADIAINVVAVIAIELLAVYLFRVSSYVYFPADFLTWSEPDFISDITKFIAGYPLYSAPISNDSYTYPPGPQLLTYVIARLTGFAGSIPAYRVIQLVYVAGAAFMALLSSRVIIRMAYPESEVMRRWRWNVFLYAALFLIATNALTNPYVHNLHGDALSLLVNATAFYLLVRYAERPDRAVLAGMALIAPLGFLVKQNIVIWGALYTGVIAFQSRSLVRAARFAITTGCLFMAVVLACRAIWGEPFFYWIFYLLSHHLVSPLRSVLHILDCWPYFTASIVGCALVLRGRDFGPLFAAWAVSFAVLAVEAYTSGIAWMLNHAGPGCLLAGVWLVAGLAANWNRILEAPRLTIGARWMRAAMAVAVVVLALNGLATVRVPLRPLSPDAGRYVSEIEASFEGARPDRVLLDAGTWIYAKNRVVMPNRAPAICEQGYCDAGDFSRFESLLRQKYYSKILVRGLHDADFWYENSLWPRPRGLRRIILENYRETGHIRAVEPPGDVKDRSEDPYLFGEITILQPKTGSNL